jgi:soluble lytic murein transglycosylase-like protein
VEGGRPGLAAINKDGSEDLGVMQINTLWVVPLAQRTGQSQGTVRRRLLDEPCFNIAAAGAIIRIYLNETRGDVQQAIGNYHSHTPVRHNSYRLKVLEAAGRLTPQMRQELIKGRVSSIDR